MDIETLEREALNELDRAASLGDLDSLSVKYLGRKEGALTKILRGIKELSPDEKKRIGQAANQLRSLLEERITAKQKALQSKSFETDIGKDTFDLTLPGPLLRRGHSHPLLETIREISAIFKQIGFDVVEGPDIETDRNNFTDLNIPENHPARDAHDTFYLNLMDKGKDGGPLLLRTHTSPVQIRLMKKVKPPVRIIAPGRVYRHEAVDATHAAIFYQIEGLAVDEGITFTDLKGSLNYFARKFFGPDLAIRFRPSYFPFVEPGAEMDLQCFRCHGTGRSKQNAPCSLCKASGWIEMLGAGMVHPQVLRNVGYDPEKYTGYAFGMGIDRIIMTRNRVTDIRNFLESDLRFLEQF